MATYSIKDIVKMSGIKAHTIRMWERRFGLVIPKRTDTNIRYYSDEDLRDILNISILNQNGLKISKIAKLTKEELREKVANLLDNPNEYGHVIDAMLISMIEIDEAAFNKSFSGAWHEYGFENLIEKIMFPFLERIGILWQTNSIKPAQEHFIINLLRQKIIATIDKEIALETQGEDKIIFFLPEGELHEVGLLFYSYIAHKEGFGAQFIHHTHREGYLLHVVTLVVVETTLQGHHIFVAQTAKYQFDTVSLNRAYREIRNILIGKLIYYLDFFGKVSQPRAKNDGSVRTHLRVGFNPRSSFFNLL